MIIQPQILRENLNQQISTIYFIYGDEPLQRQESLDQIQNSLLRRGYQKELTLEANAAFDFNFLAEQIQTIGLFSNQRIFRVNLTDFALKGSFMADLLKQLALSTDVWVLIFPKNEPKMLKTTWYQELTLKHSVVPCKPLNRQETLSWIKHRLAIENLNGDPEFIQYLLEKTEGNLLATHQAIEKLKLLSEKPSLQLLRTILQDNTQYTLFEFIDTLLGRSPERMLKILSRLQQEGTDPILILWAIARTLRQVCAILAKVNRAELASCSLSSFGIWKNKERLFRHFLTHTPDDTLLQGFQDAQQLDSDIKSYTNRSIWRNLLVLCLKLIGVENYALQ